VQVTTDTQLAVNTSYSINATTPTLTVTLPATAALDDIVSITGTSATAWTVAQNAGQSIVTSGMSGNTAPGAAWTPRLTPKVWHWVSSDATGEVLLAGEADGGSLNVSADGGQHWTQASTVVGGVATPIPGIWISSDMTPADVSPQGKVMVAVQYAGHMYMSSDTGKTWQQLTDPAVNDPAGLNFESVTISADGKHLAAVVQSTGSTGPTPNGRLALSDTGGTSWTIVAPGTRGLPVGTYFWRSIDSSSDGKTIVAVGHNGEMFRSTDTGATWNAVAVTVAGAPVADTSWYRVKLSADGSTIAVGANSFGTAPGTGVFISSNGGQTWIRGAGLPASAEYSAIAMSSDGKKIAASLSNSNHTTDPVLTGSMVLSTDGGAHFAPLTMPGTDTDWRAVAMSADGDKLAAAAGRFVLPAPYTAGHTGQLYTSQGNRTSVGTGGSITAHQNDSITLKYTDTVNHQWTVQDSSGGPFTIR
jgi:hypothetical protein